MEAQDELAIGPRASVLKKKIQSNRLYDDDRPPTREEQAKRRARETGISFMGAISGHEGQLSSLLSHGCRLVGNVEIAAVSAEVLAVTDDECQTSKWKEELKKDEAKTGVILKTIYEEWEKTHALEVAEDLQVVLRGLQDESEKLVTLKRDLVNGLLQQLDASDNCFKNERIIQAQQRTQIISRVTEHVLELIRAYRNSLRSLHTASEENQENLANYYRHEIDKAAAELNAKLRDLMKQRQQKRHERMEDLIAIHVHGTGRGETTDQRGRDVEEVLLELYRLRTRQKVEEEQLQFNLIVLRQQLKETTCLVSEGRRKINELRPAVMDYRRKWEKHEKVRSREQRMKMMEIIQKKEKLRDMKARLSQLTAQTASQLRGVAYLRYTQLQDIVMKTNELERSIELTILSRDFLPPDMSLLMELHPALQPKDTPALAAAARILGPPEDDYDIDVSEEERILEETFLKETVKAADFLVNSAHEMSFETQSPPLLTLEHIFWELNIKTEQDINKILNSAKRKWYARRSSTGGETVDNSEDSRSIFTPEEVLTTLMEFSKERARIERVERMKEKSSYGSSNLSGVLLMTEEDESKWMKLVDETTVERKKCWKIIRDALKKYLLVLNGRQHESVTVENLRQENRELRHLLLGSGCSDSFR